ncbi:MAG: hypothetical protein JWP75_1958 [Frondihabitans sp.]|nr:hypothetical protein [Frondihabitans sp.]
MTSVQAGRGITRCSRAALVVRWGMHRGHRILPALLIVGATTSVWLVSEWLTWRASREGLTTVQRDTRRVVSGEAVLVLGYTPSRNGRINAMQRWRVRIAVRSTDPATALFVFSGAATRGPRTEAALMADYAVDALGVRRSNTALEEQARSTWDNITFSRPLIAAAPAIKIASNTFHARRARAYLRKQDPALAARLHRARDYRFAEAAPLKPLLALYEWGRAVASILT